MHRISRTLALAGLAGLLASAAHAQVFVNGAPATVNGVTQFVWNGQNISAANPVPVVVIGGGAGGGGTANPYPGADYATSARQDTGNAGIGAPGDATYAGTGNAGLIGLNKGQYAILANLLAAYGTAADTAAAATGANGTDIALLKALRDKLNGTLTVGGTVTANVGTTNGLALDATLTGRLGTLGQKASAGSAPVVIASDQPAIPVSGGVVATPADAPAPTTFSFTAAGSTAWIDTTGYAFVDVDLATFGAGNSVVVQYQGSGGAANPATVLYPGNLAFGGLLAFQSVPTTGLTRVPVQGKLMRLTVASYGSGTVAGSLTLRANGWAPNAVYVTNNINATPTASASVAGPTPVTTTTSAVVGKASAANLYGYSITQGSTAGFLAILNATAAPAASAAIAPLECVPVAANGYVARRQDIPDRYTTGLVIVSTSSCATYTAVTPVLMSVVAQ